MSKLLIGLIGCIVGAVGMLLLCFYIPLFIAQKNDAGVKVALFYPVAHPSIDEINQGFQDTLKGQIKKDVRFDSFNGNGNRALMRSQAEEIVSGAYDLIFTVGMNTTMLTKEIAIKKKKLVPLVFSAVTRPVELGLIDSFESSKNHVTGIADEQNYERQFELLSLVKQDIKTILLVYNPQEGTGLEQNKNQIRQILEKKSINLETLEVFTSGEIYSKASGALNGVDVVLVLTDNTVVSAIDSLVKLCNRHRVPLYASEADSVRRGAAFGCGIPQREYGVRAAYQAKAILVDGKQPADISVQKLEELTLYINEDAAQRQGVTLNLRDRELIAHAELVTP